MSGWDNPMWQALYPPIAADLQITPQPVNTDPPVHYLDVLAGAAATNQSVNLSDMPGYETNLENHGQGA